jgi:hypothetical protein
MSNIVGGRKRSKFVRGLFLPVGIFIFLIGWGLYFVGQRSSDETKQKTRQVRKENIEFRAIPVQVQEIPVD